MCDDYEVRAQIYRILDNDTLCKIKQSQSECWAQRLKKNPALKNTLKETGIWLSRSTSKWCIHEWIYKRLRQGVRCSCFHSQPSESKLWNTLLDRGNNITCKTWWKQCYAYSSIVEVGQRSSKIILSVVGPNLLRCVLAVVLCFAVSS